METFEPFKSSPTAQAVVLLCSVIREAHNGAGGIPAFGLEPKSAEQISIGALPLWCRFAPVTPMTWGSFSPKPSRVRIPQHQVSLPNGAVGIRTPVTQRVKRFSRPSPQNHKVKKSQDLQTHKTTAYKPAYKRKQKIAQNRLQTCPMI
jgi:hypothetical protein